MDMTEQLIMGGSVCSIEFVIACVPMIIMVRHWRQVRRERKAKRKEKEALTEILDKRGSSESFQTNDCVFQVIEKGMPTRQVSEEQVSSENDFPRSSGSDLRKSSDAKIGGLMPVPETPHTNGNGNGLSSPRTPATPQAKHFETLEFPAEHETPPVAFGSRPQMLTTCRTTPRSSPAAIFDKHVSTQCCD